MYFFLGYVLFFSSSRTFPYSFLCCIFMHFCLFLTLNSLEWRLFLAFAVSSDGWDWLICITEVKLPFLCPWQMPAEVPFSLWLMSPSWQVSCMLAPCHALTAASCFHCLWLQLLSADSDQRGGGKWDWKLCSGNFFQPQIPGGCVLPRFGS